jgi:hypothetical protein
MDIRNIGISKFGDFPTIQVYIPFVCGCHGNCALLIPFNLHSSINNPNRMHSQKQIDKLDMPNA